MNNKWMKLNSSGWAKCLASKGIIFGEDALVDSQKVSWRKTDLDNLIGVSLAHVFPSFSLQGSISGLGNFWQSDSYCASFGVNQTFRGVREKRRIQKKLTPEDGFLDVYSNSGEIHIFTQESIAKLSDSIENYTRNLLVLNKNHYNLWVIIEIDIFQKDIKWYLSPERI